MPTRVLLSLVLASTLVPLHVARVGAQPAPAAGAAAQTGRAAGMALHDGTLPPGTLTARVVRGNFSGNLAGVEVTLDVAGEASKQAPTAADGRAQFAHLTVGATVRVSAVVDGERLQSEPIVMPAESGVRVLLVSGDQFVDTTKPGQVATLPPLDAAPPLGGALGPPLGSAPPAPPGSDPDTVTLPVPAPSAAAPPAGDGVTALRAVMITLTILAFGAVAYGQWRRKP